MFRRLLIANRGEVAVRIARAARELGIAPVGIVSEADRDASWTSKFDEVVCVGPAPAAESYLRMNRIIQAAIHGTNIEGATLYCTNMPCAICSKMLINSKITEVYYREGYADELSSALMAEAGINLHQLE